MYLGKGLKKRGNEVSCLLGARSKCDLLLLDMFSQYGNLFLSTEDGSMGEKGLVTQNSVMQTDFDFIQCCGPKPMMMAVANIAKKRNVECEVSLENMMA